MSYIKKSLSHVGLALLEAALISALVVGLIAGTAFAGKGGNGGGGGGKPSGGGGTISLALFDGGDAIANHGERAGFNVSTTATDRPFVGVRCYQGAAFVLDGYTGYFPTYMFDPWVMLSSPYWDPSVSADCTARLFRYDSRARQIVLATVSFVAYP